VSPVTVSIVVTVGPMASQNPLRIQPLDGENFNEWLVDIRSYLRQRKLWAHTQSPYVPEVLIEGEESSTATVKKREKAQKDWKGKAQDAADIITSSKGVKTDSVATHPLLRDAHARLWLERRPAQLGS